ncbi:hypothetical protein GIS00_23900 [Nakamurella sp. YIM 132087]|uniref:ATP-binding protein n=1 Tax=Nakamurella alba TaxID=2665158 RepID=A0A7K1FW01_9ACTN|nr:hypothetical protein [Nakamurella alba]MTD16984.1 hypothetical protein [Nakamurella alba]
MNRSADPSAVGPTGAADPFGTAQLRQAVLQAWTASPRRFREDANAEEALALGGYADRVIEELAANGVDAAVAAGVPAHLAIRVTAAAGGGAVLVVANTGAPLTADGVAALASLRASAKRGTADGVGQVGVGHFGVGFTAVSTISDHIVVRSTSGAVFFDRAATAALLDAADGDLRGEVQRRDGRVPTLRLPFALDTTDISAGVVTEVELAVPPDRLPDLQRVLDRLRAGGARDLFFSLPDLRRLEVRTPDGTLELAREDGPDGEVVLRSASGDAEAYRVVTRTGTIPPDLLADRPVEEQERTRWSLSWVLPAAPVASDVWDLPGERAATPVPPQLGAPMPTDERLTLPAGLVGTFPVEDTRRRLAPGPLTDHLMAEAVTGYLELVVSLPPDRRWDLVPGNGFPVGEVDGRLQSSVLEALRSAPVLVSTAGDPVTPDAASMVEGVGPAAAELLGQAVPGLVPEPDTAAGRAAARRLGIIRRSLSEAVAALAGLDRPAEFWSRLYELLADRSADDMAGVPVPLADGDRRIGARGTLLADDSLAEIATRVADLVPGLPLVHAAAAHRALLRWGAERAGADELLAAPAVLDRFADFRDGLDDAEPDPDELDDLAGVALDLAAAGGRGGALGVLVLTDADGLAWPAAELLLPGAVLADVLADDADLPEVHPDWTSRPAEVLLAAGLRSGFGIIETTLDDSFDPDDPRFAAVADLDRWWQQLPAGVATTGGTASLVADLDLVDEDRWPQALRMLAEGRDSRAALLTGVGDGPGYAAWWIGEHARFDGRRAGTWMRPGGTIPRGLYEDFPFTDDRSVAAAIGVPADLSEAVRQEPGDLLQRYADPARTVPPAAVPALTAAVVALVREDPDLPLPAFVRAVNGSAVPAEDAVVLDVPWYAGLLDPATVVPGGADPASVADLLDLRTASESAVRPGPGSSTTLDPGVLDRISTALGAGLPVLRAVDALTVSAGDRTVGVAFWPDGDGGWWVDGIEGACLASAWHTGHWTLRRTALAAALGRWTDLAVDDLGGSQGGQG